MTFSLVCTSAGCAARHTVTLLESRGLTFNSLKLGQLFFLCAAKYAFALLISWVSNAISLTVWLDQVTYSFPRNEFLKVGINLECNIIHLGTSKGELPILCTVPNTSSGWSSGEVLCGSLGEQPGKACYSEGNNLDGRQPWWEITFDGKGDWTWGLGWWFRLIRV